MPDSIIDKAVSCHQQGDRKQAEKYYLKALKKRPADAQLNYLLGILYGELQQYQKAVLRLKKAAQLKPDNAEYSVKYGFSLAHTDEFNQSVAVLKNVLKTDPVNTEAYNNLSLAYLGLNDYSAAIDACQQALQIQPKYLQAKYNLARSYQLWGKDADAKATYLDILNQTSEHASSLLALGILYQEAGEFDQAIEYFQKTIKVDPANAEAYFHLSRLLEVGQLKDLVNKIEVARMRPHDLGSEIYLDFAQGKNYNRLGDDNRAFRYLAAGNAKRSRAVPYNSKHAEKQRDIIQELFKPEYVQSIESQIGGCDDESCIFIVGMPRSGTTLVESILAAHSNVIAGGELSILHKLIRDEQLKSKRDYLYQSEKFSFENYIDISAQYLALRNGYVDTDSSGFVTDKYLHNFYHIGLIKLAFPRAKIIHCRRNAADTCLSIYMNYFSGALRYAFDMKNMAHFYSTYVSMMDYWDRIFSDIYHVSYENLVNHQESESRRLFEFIGLPWEDQCLKFYENKHNIRTVSMQQTRQPIYKTSVSRWKKYEQHIQPLLSSLQHYGVDY